MSIYDVFSSMKDLVNTCDELLDQGKTALLTRDVEKLITFMNTIREMMPRIKELLIHTKGIIMESDKEDKLVKYINVYYRMMVMVDLPYITMILRDSSSIFTKYGHDQEASMASNLANEVESFLDTLRR